jgi:hypothetical protein
VAYVEALDEFSLVHGLMLAASRNDGSPESVANLRARLDEAKIAFMHRAAKVARLGGNA